MPFTVGPLDGHDVCHAQIGGVINADTIIDMIDAVLRDPAYQQHQGVVVTPSEDLRLSSPVQTMRNVEHFARSNDHRFTGSRWAVFATARVHYGLVRMYQIWRDDASYKVAAFRTLAEAADWVLNRP